MYLQTHRLTMRPFTTGDTAFILELLNSPGWLRFIGDRNVKTETDAKMYLENGPIKSYSENGYGLCMVERTSDAKPIGMCGIIRRDNLEHPDIGFAFLPGFQNQGYAFEMASATLKHAQDNLKISPVYAITVSHNERSVKLLEKIGLKFVRTIYPFPGKEAVLLFSTE